MHVRISPQPIIRASLCKGQVFPPNSATAAVLLRVIKETVCFANMVGCACSAQRGISSLASDSKRQGKIIKQRLNKKNYFLPSSIMPTNGEEHALREWRSE